MVLEPLGSRGETFYSLKQHGPPRLVKHTPCPIFPLHQFAGPGGSQYWVSGILVGFLSPQEAWHGGPPFAFTMLFGSNDDRVRPA